MPTFPFGYRDDADGLGTDHLTIWVFRAPMLSVGIGFDPYYNSSKPAGYPALPADNLLALVESGARESCIDCDLAKRLSLPFVGIREMLGAHGPKNVNVYRAQLSVPNLN